MIERERNAKVKYVRAYCECGGEFEYNNSQFTFDIFPSYTTYRHKCNKCDKEESFNDKYPTIRFIEDEV